MRFSSLSAALLILVFASFTQADDWPQWLGPNRESVWKETGIVKEFPEEGLPVKWRAEVGLGYSGPAVADGRVFITDYVRKSGTIINNPGARDRLTGEERVTCFAAASGEQLWRHSYPREYSISYAAGPRCTPTVDGDRVYTLGAEGDLLCLEAATGKVVWSKLLTEEYETETPLWGFSAHPLVDGDLLYCVVGGAGSVAVAFDKKTGKEVWKALSAKEPGYCPPSMIEQDGEKQLIIWHPKLINALEPATGKLLWSIPLEPDYGMSIAIPRKSGDHLFASGIGNVAALLKLPAVNGEPKVEWLGRAKTAVYASNATPFLEDGMIYGSDCQNGALIGVRMKDGQRMWETYDPTTGNRRGGHGTAFIVKHEDRFVLFSETGDLILADLSSQGYKELDRLNILEPTNESFGRPVVWSHPAFANKCIYARNDKELVCVSLAAQ